jgi:small-conductance mechanosensitive channel
VTDYPWDWHLLGVHVPLWAYAPVFLSAWIILGLGAKALALGRLRGAGGSQGVRFRGILARALNIPLLLLILATGLVALNHWTPARHFIEGRLNTGTILAVVAIAAGILFADSLLRGLIQLYAERVEILKTAGGLLQGLVRGIVIVIGLLTLLETLGIPITPLIASIGVGSLAVALALQPTLESFFAGVQLVTDRPIRVGDFVRLESGEEGYVDTIGWRTTWIRMLPNNMLIIPNKQLVSSRVINYFYPSRDLMVPVDIGVHHRSDLEKVERVTTEVAEEIQRTVPGAAPDFKPAVRFTALGSSGIHFTVALRANDVSDAGLIRHAFLKALVARYAKEGIVIPYPVTAVNLDQERATPAAPAAAPPPSAPPPAAAPPPPGAYA